MEHIASTRICLPYARAIMVHLCVSLVELPVQTMMGWIPVLEYMLSGARGFLQPRPILSGNECYRHSRP
jgi:hypothetical protein